MTMTTKGKFIGVIATVIGMFLTGVIMLAFEASKHPIERDQTFMLVGYILCSLSMLVLWWIVICSYLTFYKGY